MKYIAALTCLLLAAVITPSFAHEMTNNCAQKFEKIANKKEREASIKECLKKASSPENVAKQEQHDKEQHCDTNAESMKLTGKDKTDYLEHCYHESDLNPHQKPHPKAAK